MDYPSSAYATHGKALKRFQNKGVQTGYKIITKSGKIKNKKEPIGGSELTTPNPFDILKKTTALRAERKERPAC